MQFTNLSRKIRSLLLLLALAACATDGDQAAVDTKLVLSEPPRSNQATPGRADADRQSTDGRVAQRVDYFEGSGVFARQIPPVEPVRENLDGGLSLTFKNMDIRTIVRAVLLDTLGQTYSIDPRVQGTATLETSGPISKESLQQTLETLLRTKGFALVMTADGYHVLPISEAPQRISSITYGLPSSVNLPGFGIHVVPLKFTSATDMQSLLAPFAPQGGVLRADNMRNFLILGGTSQEVTSMLRAIQTFDVDWMSGMSFGIYSLKYAEVDQILEELSEIFASQEMPNSGSVRFIPIPRINKLLAIAPQRDVLQMIEFWIGKLDLGESSPGRRIYVYQVKNGRATDLADTLNMILNTQLGGRGFNGAGLAGRGNASGRAAQGNNALRNRNGFRGNTNGTGLDLESALNDAGIRIVPNEENNSVVMLATPSELSVIEGALRQLDVSPRQVLVEVTLAEVTLTDELRYGLQWHFEFGENSVSFGKSAQPTSEFPGFSWGYTNNSSASAVLNALESLTDVKVISSPKLLVLNNQSATLQVGDEVPVPTQSAVSTNDSNAPIVNSIQYRTTGVILTVTPRINEGGLIMMDIEQEVSSVVETRSSGIDAPTIQQRRITSAVAVQNGTTIALGGLIRSTVNNVKSGVPILKDIPLLGAAFSENDLTERRSELVVLMTPRIIRDEAEQREVMDYLQNEFRNLIAPRSEENNSGQ